MAKKTYQAQLPWEDRWNEPEVQSLLSQLRDPQVKPFKELLKRLDETEGIERELSWQGISWKWSFVYRIQGGQTPKSGLEEFAYLVPRPGSVAICIPLTSDMIAALPFRRLNRYIRDGIRVAKCAVDIHWATWTPMAMTEVEHLHDLIKRKHRFLFGDDRKKKAEEAETGKTKKKTSKSKAQAKPAAEASKKTKKKATATKKTEASKKKAAAKSTKTTKKSKVSKKSKPAATTKTTSKKTTTKKSSSRRTKKK